MLTVEELRLPQTHETTAMVVAGEVFHLQVAYARSADSRASDDPGQDYLTVRQDGVRFAFALCDGVSQSFVGDLAARVLGEAMLQWLWQLDASTIQAQAAQEACQQHLSALVSEVAQQVAKYPLPTNLPPMLREVLERKRELGSESTLAAGLLDVAADKLLLVWLGDSRIRLWDQQGECTTNLGTTFLTQERWSTHRGPIGRVHVFIASLNNIKRVVAYSDGLAIMDRGLNDSLTMRSLDATIAEAGDAPTSDDISFLEVRFSPFVEAEGEPRRFSSMAEAMRLTDAKPQPLKAETPPVEAATAVQMFEAPAHFPAQQTAPRTSAVASPSSPSPQPTTRPPAPVSTRPTTPAFYPQPSSSRTKPTRRFDGISRVGIGVIGVVVVLCLALAGALGLGFWPSPRTQETATHTPTFTATVTATEVIATYVVTPTVGEGGGGSIEPSGPQTIKEGESVTFQFVPEEGYEVAEVLIDDQPIGKRDAYTITAISTSQALVVRFDPKTYSITLTTDGEGGTIVGEVGNEEREAFFRVKHNESVRLLIEPDEGYTVAWLKINGRDVEPTPEETVDEQPMSWSHVIPNVREEYSVMTAFRLKEYSITAMADAGGSISPTGKITVTYGSTRTFYIKPNEDEGYRIAAVQVDNEEVSITGIYTFTRVVKNHTIYAQFEKRTYTVTLKIEGLPEGVSPTVEPKDPWIVKHDETVKFNITPPYGYRLKEVLFGDQTLQEWVDLIKNAIPENTITFESPPIIKDIEIKVVFEPVQ